MAKALQNLYNINVPAIFTPFETINSDEFVEKLCDLAQVNTEFLKWLGNFGIGITKCIFFNTPSKYETKIHIDGLLDNNKPFNCAKINMIYNSTDSTMRWYQALPGHEAGTIQKNSLQKSVQYWSKDQCQVTESHTANSHCIINGAKIHDLVNGDNNLSSRQCYSLILKDKVTGMNLTWIETYTRLCPILA